MPVRYKILLDSSKTKDQKICDALNLSNPTFKCRITTKDEDVSGKDIVIVNSNNEEIFIDTKYVGAKTNGKGSKYVEIYEIIDEDYLANQIWYVVYDKIYIFDRKVLQKYLNENKDIWKIDKRQPMIIRKHGEVIKYMLYIDSYEKLPYRKIIKNPIFNL